MMFHELGSTVRRAAAYAGASTRKAAASTSPNVGKVLEETME
jgi:hypothetical protein